MVWTTTERWNAAQEEFKKTEEYNAFLDDESNACDWDTPIEIICENTGIDMMTTAGG